MKSKYGILCLAALTLTLLSLIRPVALVTGERRNKNMVLVKGGIFHMGSDSLEIKGLADKLDLPYDYLSTEVPKHAVKLSSYYIDKYEVTNAEYKKFIDANPDWKKEKISAALTNGNYLKTWINDSYPTGEDFLPVTNITWYSAMAYAKWVGKRLPSEAEWEYAAKSGKDKNVQYPWGNTAPDSTRANYGSRIGHPVRVGSFAPNELGIYDLSGNVWEYCLDAWDDDSYRHSLFRDPISGKDSLMNFLRVKNRRVIRGGSWAGGPVNMRTTFRDSHPVNGAGDHVGFRCAKDIH